MLNRVVLSSAFGLMVGMACVLGVAAPVAVAQPEEAVEVVVSAEEGVEWVYRFRTELEIEQRGSAAAGEDAGELPAQSQSYDAVMRFRVRSLEADGSGEVSVVVLRYAAAWTGAGEANSVSADLEALRARMEGADAAGAMAEEEPGTRAMGALARATGVIELGEGGSVDGVRGFSTFERTVRSMGEVDDRAIGFFTNTQVLELVRPLFEAEGAAGSAWSVGDGWQSERTVEVSNLGALDYMYEWTVAGAAGNDVVMEGEAALSLRVPEVRDARVPVLSLTGGEESVRSVWDLRGGMLKERVATHEVSMTFAFTGAERELRLEQSSAGETRIERVQSED